MKRHAKHPAVLKQTTPWVVVTIIGASMMMMAMFATTIRAEMRFGDPILTENVSAANPFADGGPNLSSDGLTMYFHSERRPGPEWTAGLFYLYKSQRDTTERPWKTPEPLPATLIQGGDSGPSISADGLTLYFSRGDEYGPGHGADIYFTKRETIDDPWQEPQAVNAINANGSADLYPEISSDGLELYFNSARRGINEIWVSRRDRRTDPWSEPEAVDELNDAGINGGSGISLSTDGLTMIYSSTQGASSPIRSSDYNLWMSQRDTVHSPWQNPTRLPDTINDFAGLWPHLSPDGTTLYFSGTPIDTTDLRIASNDLDIWQVPIIPPLPGDLNGDDVLDASDIDLLRGDLTDSRFDLNEDGRIDEDDRSYWVNSLAKTYFGDANLDGEFNSRDFTQVFLAGEYEDAIEDNSGWAEGDWDGDGDFTSGDFVAAFLDGGYEQGPRPAAVPEPSTCLLIVLAMLKLATTRRKTTAQLCG